MDNREYWLMLQTAFGCGSSLVRRVIDYFGSPREFFEAGENEWRLCGFINPQRLLRCASVSSSAVQDIITECEKQKYKILTPDCPEYPARLRRIENYPAVLFVRGELPLIDDEVCIAVVGTRNVSEYGKSAAHAIASQIAAGGAIIVSGGALGVDSIAHRAALQQKAKTVAVLGCGLSYPYLMGNEWMRTAVAESGAVVTEYPPKHAPSRTTFPIRNRIISGLSLGTVVIEASAKSGSLITANHALAQGRDVFAVPGSAISPLYDGTNNLLKDGAKPVFSGVDVLEEYAADYPHKVNLKRFAVPPPAEVPQSVSRKPKSAKAQKTAKSNAAAESVSPKVTAPLPDGAGEAAAKIYTLLKNGPMVIEELVAQSEMSAVQVMQGVTELELFGVLKCSAGKKYELN